MKLPLFAKRFRGKAEVVRAVEIETCHHALLRATKDFKVWKRVMGIMGRKTISLTIPKGTRFWCHEHTQKCRAEIAISGGDGVSIWNGGYKVSYKTGVSVRPTKGFNWRPVICGSGIHFYTAQKDAGRH